MNFRYFMRGLGVGVLFSGIIFMVAYMTMPSTKLSDKDIIQKAKELGMVEEEDTIGELLEEDSKSDIADDKKEEAKDQKKDESVQEATTKEVTTQEETTQDGASEEQNKKEKTTEVKPETTVEVTVSPGESSYPICQKLQELGLIEDAQAYDDYLIEHGYASRISVGTHTLKKGMSHEEIAIAISDKE